MDQYPIDEPGTVDEQLTALGITLEPCPAWCAGDHFGPQPILYAEDGFYHYGPETTITDNSTNVESSSQDLKLTLGLASWVPALADAPSRAHVRLSGGDTDGAYFFTPTCARQLAAELTRLADQADER